MINEVSVVKTLCVGQFIGAHGVRGLVKLRSFTEVPEAIFDYAPLLAEDGKRTFKIAPKSAAKDHFITTVEGITSREAANELRGEKIFIPRDVLPAPREGEYYDADIVGLLAFDAEGKEYGKVIAIHDHGAGVFLEIGPNHKDSFMLPFKDAFVPIVDLEAGKLQIVVPEGWV